MTTVQARHYATGESVKVSWQADRLTAVEPLTSPAPDDPWVAPALVDSQVNGFAGVDFQGDSPSPEDLSRAVEALRRTGCTRFFLTLITDEWRALMNRLRGLKHLRDSSPTLRHAISGWHIEGPFLSEKPGFRGAHPEQHLIDPSPSHLDELRRITGSDPTWVTLAPERRGGLEAIRHAVSLGITVRLGHTDASAMCLREAVAAGASGFTHLGNACPQQLDRHDNILWRVLDLPNFKLSLICDGIHVAPALFRLIHRTVPAGSIEYTTDAMAAAGAPPGRYTLGQLRLEVGGDGIVRQPGATNFAGSALRPFDGVSRAAAMLRCDWTKVWDHFSRSPASSMGLPSGLTAGAPADLCLIRMSHTGACTLERVITQGRDVELAPPRGDTDSGT